MNEYFFSVSSQLIEWLCILYITNNCMVFYTIFICVSTVNPRFLSRTVQSFRIGPYGKVNIFSESTPFIEYKLYVKVTTYVWYNHDIVLFKIFNICRVSKILNGCLYVTLFNVGHYATIVKWMNSFLGS